MLSPGSFKDPLEVIAHQDKERAVGNVVCFTTTIFCRGSGSGRRFIRGGAKQHDKWKGVKRVEDVCKEMTEMIEHTIEA